MKRSLLRSALFAASAAAALNFTPSTPGRIQDSLGRAGMVAAPLAVGEETMVLVGGGANFPYAKPGAKTPEERGAKVFYRDVAVLPHPVVEENCPVQPIATASLPRPIGYAAFVPTKQGVVIAGGCNNEGHVAKVGRLEFVDNELRMGALPELPRTVAYPAFAVVDSRLYVLGGQEKPDSTTCMNNCFVLDLNDLNAGWKELAPMPGGRMLAAAGVLDGLIYVMGGCSLAPDEQGNARRTYLKEVLCYDPVSNTWAKVASEMPETNVGMANPLPVLGNKLYVVGGDPGNFYRASLEGQAPEVHPGQSKAVYSFTPSTGAWKKEGELRVGVATLPAVVLDGVVYTISGETHPGIRTPMVDAFMAD